MSSWVRSMVNAGMMILPRRELAFVDDLDQFFLGHADGLVQAVAVRSLQYQVIHGRHDLGIADDGQTAATEVAAEADAQAALDGQVQHGRTEDMSGIEEFGFHAFQRPEFAAVIVGDKIAHGVDGLFGAV